ncbi:methyltransferase 4 [Pelomyxa schiedti]|nr:methyltransferase 4 [Pelomyxa schiedti]
MSSGGEKEDNADHPIGGLPTATSCSSSLAPPATSHNVVLFVDAVEQIDEGLVGHRLRNPSWFSLHKPYFGPSTRSPRSPALPTTPTTSSSTMTTVTSATTATPSPHDVVKCEQEGTTGSTTGAAEDGDQDQARARASERVSEGAATRPGRGRPARKRPRVSREQQLPNCGIIDRVGECVSAARAAAEAQLVRNSGGNLADSEEVFVRQKWPEVLCEIDTAEACSSMVVGAHGTADSERIPPLFVSSAKLSSCGITTTPSGGMSSLGSAFHRLVENRDAAEATICLGNDRYLMPPQSAFVMTDASSFKLAVKELLQSTIELPESLQPRVGPNGFDCVIIDPPWKNKSAQRAHVYHTLSDDELSALPVAGLLKPHSLVAVWVTNDPRLWKLTTQTLFSQWGLQYHTTWLWVKVTSFAELVCPVSSPHKKPYEPVVVGITPTIHHLMQCPGTSFSQAVPQAPNEAMLDRTTPGRRLHDRTTTPVL